MHLTQILMDQINFQNIKLLEIPIFPINEWYYIINHKRKMIYLLENANTSNHLKKSDDSVQTTHGSVLHSWFICSCIKNWKRFTSANVRIGWKRNACEFIIRWKSNGDIGNLSWLRFNFNVSRVHLFQMKALDFFC